MSIRFETLHPSMDRDVRQLKELRLWEIRVVTFPMNEDAQIQSGKSLAADRVEKVGCARRRTGERLTFSLMRDSMRS